MQVEPIFADPGRFWALYLAVPLVAALLGYLVNSLAEKLLFTQMNLPGSVYRHNARLATLHSKLVADALVDAQELFARVEPRQLAAEIDKPLRRTVDELTVEVATQYRPGLWEMLPLRVKQLFTSQIREQAPAMAAELFEELTVDAAEMFHLEHLVHTRLTEDAALLARLTKRIADPVLAAMRLAGAVIGLLIGLLALLVLGLTGSLLVLPVAGLLAGFAARWCAPYALFLPRNRRRWPFAGALQGRFFTKRVPVAAGYAEILSKDVLSFDGIVRELTAGERSDRLAELVRRNVHRKIDTQLNVAKPFVVATFGSRQFQGVKQTVSTKVFNRIPEVLRPSAGYVTTAMDVRNTIGHRVRTLQPARYELLLRPAIEQDRWQSALFCALLGAILGGLGMLAMLGL